MRWIFKFINFLAVLVLLLSCAAAYIPPQIFWPLSFIGFAFPAVLLFNFFFLVLWIIKRDAFGLFSLFALVLSWSAVQSTFAFRLGEKQNKKGIKLMTWNVKSFDLYNWNKNEQTREKMMQLIATENPDVLCLQEFYTNNQLFQNLAYLRDSLGYKYSYFSPSIDLKKLPKSKLQKTLWRSGELHQQWGVATFSKLPITHTATIDFKNSLTNECAVTDMEIDGKPIRLYNVHFQSIHLGYNDYAALDSLKEKQTTNLQSVKSIVKKMMSAYTKRAEQANQIADNSATYSGVKIICGDFNDVPVSYVYQTAKGELQDAFVEKGAGFGATYIHRLSLFRIDYMLFDKRIKINSYKTIREELSDHYPVVSTFTF